jgi:uncharacterized SAM-binding protein YcdF (DUF218 family)
MFFILSKTLGLLTVPSDVITILFVAGLLLLLTRYARAGRRLLLICLAIIAIFGMLPFGKLMTLIVEERFPPWAIGSGKTPDGIIVLGGAIEPDTSARHGSVALNDTAERVTAIAALARRFPEARIVFTGGSANLIFSGPPESAYALDLFESFGIPRSRVTLEERSRNTAENARFTKALLDPKPGERWLLVTSAAHMPRAIGSFRKAGFPIEAYPVDWNNQGWSSLFVPEWPLYGLRAADIGSKEWVGLLAYWLAGYTSDLFPAPLNPGAAVADGKRP